MKKKMKQLHIIKKVLPYLMTTLLALAVLLSRWAGVGDVAVGTPVAGRGERELDNLIGMFVNTLVLRSRVSPRQSFADLLTATRETARGVASGAFRGGSGRAAGHAVACGLESAVLACARREIAGKRSEVVRGMQEMFARGLGLPERVFATA